MENNKPAISITFTYNQSIESYTGEPILVKIHCEKKYFIWKILKISTIKEGFKTQIERELLIPKPDSIFSKLCDHIRKTKCFDVRIELVKSYPDKLKLLIDEYNLLQASKKDKLCLNKDFNNIKYYPNWIPQDVVNNFKKYYTTGKNTGSSNKDKLLLKFLRSNIEGDEAITKIYNYIKTRYK